MDILLIKNLNYLMKIEEGFQFVCNLGELKEKIGKRFILDEVEIAIFKIDGAVFALNNICPHQQTHLIYEGFIENGFVICPAHGWKFNIQTGQKSSGSKGLDSYPTQIINEKVYIKIHPKKFNW
jgi:3-phenylpropionate/trans-cinnamate dioxygenase ferredoxin subunit